MTGLPQVTVPAGFIAGRYPVGVSLLGRMWDDRRLLELAADGSTTSPFEGRADVTYLVGRQR